MTTFFFEEPELEDIFFGGLPLFFFAAGTFIISSSELSDEIFFTGLPLFFLGTGTASTSEPSSLSITRESSSAFSFKY